MNSLNIKTLILIALVWVKCATAATTLYIMQPTSSWNSGYKYISTTRSVLAATTSITNTTAGGTDIQLTYTAGGTAAAWISPPLTNAFTLSGTITFNMWGLESATAANASFRGRLYKYSGGSESAALCTAQVAGELTTTSSLKTATCTPTSTSFSAGDRIVVKAFIENCSATSGCPTGTMATGSTVTLNYGGPTSAASGDTFVQLTENVTFDSEAQFLQTNASSTASVTLSGTSSTGNFLYCTCEWSPTSVNVTSVTDNKSNTYTSVTGAATTFSTFKLQSFYASNITGGTPAIQSTCNYSGSVSTQSIACTEYSGVKTTSPLDIAVANTGTSTAPTTGTITRTVTNSILIAHADNNGAAQSIGSGFVGRDLNSSNNREDKSFSILGNDAATFGLASSVPWAIQAGVFKWATQPSAPVTSIPVKKILTF